VSSTWQSRPPRLRSHARCLTCWDQRLSNGVNSCLASSVPAAVILSGAWPKPVLSAFEKCAYVPPCRLECRWGVPTPPWLLYLSTDSPERGARTTDRKTTVLGMGVAFGSLPSTWPRVHGGAATQLLDVVQVEHQRRPRRMMRRRARLRSTSGRSRSPCRRARADRTRRRRARCGCGAGR
jgi:hypothetical protein